MKSGIAKTVNVQLNGDKFQLAHGSLGISAITSCTNTSNPSVLIARDYWREKRRRKAS